MIVWLLFSKMHCCGQAETFTVHVQNHCFSGNGKIKICLLVDPLWLLFSHKLLLILFIGSICIKPTDRLNYFNFQTKKADLQDAFVS